ncbi:hypothetical protein Tco_1411665 [Tanacetum coccineum]
MVETASGKLATPSGLLSDYVRKIVTASGLSLSFLCVVVRNFSLIIPFFIIENANPSNTTHSNEFLDLEKKLEVELWHENSRSVDSLVSLDNELEDEIEGVKEEEEEDLKYFDILPTMEELGYHE